MVYSIKGILRWSGGKQKSIKYLKYYIPSSFDFYYEPFAGGLAMAFYIAQNYNVPIICSDIDPNLMNFWHCLKYYPNELFSIIDFTKKAALNGKSLYKHIQTQKNEELGLLTRAAIFFIENRITFSGLTNSGGYSEESFNKRFTKSIIEKLIPASKIIKNFEFYHKDFDYLFNLSNNNVFIYADPPYYSATNSRLYGKNGDLHIGFDHLRLRDTIKNSKHKVLTSYDDCEYIRSIYDGFNIKEIELQYGMNNVGNKTCKKGKEIIITNY